ncbi:MAG TPA: NrfD/PsrC family molybdoenzyme membrane anchor subunit [Anaerolineae bacterium]
MLRVDEQDKARLIDPLFRSGPLFWLAAALLAGVVGWGASMYLHQLDVGLVTTGMDRPSYWGMYIVNFIFLIGISMAGTLITAVLYLTGANWRRPITRIAEATTVFGLMIAGLQIIVDMGRPDRLLTLFIYGRLQSPLMWDVASLSLYLITSAFALYISMLPDLALVRDNLRFSAPGWRRQFYSLAALGWQGNREQWRRLERVLRVISILIIPIGVSLHTVTSWILSTTMQAGWHSTILGPYFVVGALFSGIALVFILLTVVRTLSPVKYYVEEKHYRLLGWLFITMSIVWFYFTYTEHLTMVAGQEEAEFPVLASKLWGADAGAFWGMVLLMLIAVFILAGPHLIAERWTRLPIFRPGLMWGSTAAACAALAVTFVPRAQPLAARLPAGGERTTLLLLSACLLVVAGIASLAWLKRHLVTGTLIASVAVVGGMWLERWNIIVPSVTHARLITWSAYRPTLTELSVTAASVALFALMLMVFFKLFPAVSLWEVAEGRVMDEAAARITIPLPPPSAPGM